MQKKYFTKKIILVCLIIVILIGGYYIKKQFDEKELIRAEGPRIEKYLRYNYENVVSVTFTKVVTHPTGIPHIKGYVNGNSELKFDAGNSRDHFNAGLNWDDDAKSLKAKEEYQYKSKTVEEIEKGEQQSGN